MVLSSLSIKSVLFLCLVLIGSSNTRKQATSESIKVVLFNSKYGNDSQCLGDSSSLPCKSLDKARDVLKKYKKNVLLEIQLDSGLSSIIEVVEGSSAVTIAGVLGNNSKYPVIQCNGSAGFHICNTQNFSLKNLALVTCNVQRDPSVLYGYAIAITESRGVLIENITISYSVSTAIRFANCTGVVLLHSVVLDSNGHGKLLARQTFAAGIHIEESREDQEQVHYSIEGCNFSNNSAPFYFDDPKGNQHSREYISSTVGYGGAIYVKFSGSTSNSSLIINYCRFEGNRGVRGGGLYAFYNDTVFNNTMIINHSNFSNNIGQHSGGAISLGYSSKTFSNAIKISHCKLLNNSARFGGGLVIFSDFSNSPSGMTNIVITDCKFLKNYGKLSSAIDIAPKDPDQDKNGFLPRVNIISCYIGGNKLVSNPTSTAKVSHLNERHTFHIFSGVVIITKFIVHLGGNTIFNRNRYSALILVSATVEFMPNSNIQFKYNIGYNGGAIGLYGFSQVKLTHNLNLRFYKNRALNHGGAIVYRTIDQHNLINGENCFFQHTDLDNQTLVQSTRVFFENNEAEVVGNSIYSESFTDCYHQCLNSDLKTDSFKPFFNYSDITSCLGNFTILPNNNQFLSSGRSFLFSESFNFTFSVIPGDQVKLPFTVVDDFNQTVKPLMTISEQNINNCQIKVDQKYTLNTTVSPKGKPEALSSFLFSVVGVRQIYFKFNISLLRCPPGFYLGKNNACQCADRERGYSHILGCSNFQAQTQLGFWVGYIGKMQNNNLYFAPCASPICSRSFNLFSGNYSSKINSLPRDPEALSTYMCDDHREGILCGKCSKGHSTHYHSREFKCKPNGLCHLGWLAYIFSELVPMVIFFVVVVVFDFSLTSGKAVGFVFFTQYLDKLTVHLDEDFAYLRTPYRVFYGLFNFEFFNVESMSFCPWADSQILDIVTLKYVTIGLALGLVLTLVCLLRNNCCTKLCRLRRHISLNNSVVHGLSALLVICYAQSSRTTFYILKYTRPTGYRGIEASEGYSYYGGLPFLQRDHLIYAIPAIVTLVFITSLPPLILLLYPLSLQLLSLCGQSEHWLVLKTLRLIGVHRLVPFLDCFQSCYKDKFRFFAGLYFIYRIVILICFSTNPERFNFHIYSEVALVVFLSIHCIIQPYKKRLHNILDSLVFSNLALINGIAILTTQLNEKINKESSPTSKIFVFVINSVQLLLLYMPMVFLLSAFTWKLYRHCKKKWHGSKYGSQQVAVKEVLEYASRTYEDSVQIKEPSLANNYGSFQ